MGGLIATGTAGGCCTSTIFVGEVSFVVVDRMESLIKPDEKAESITIFVNVLSEDETHSVIESNEITDKDSIISK